MTDWLYCSGKKAGKVTAMVETKQSGIWTLSVEGYTGDTLVDCELRREESGDVRKLMPIGFSATIDARGQSVQLTFADLGPPESC